MGALALSLGIAIQNFPEGVIISIFQCGDKDFWEYIFSAGNEERRSRENICEVYEALLKQLQQEMW